MMWLDKSNRMDADVYRPLLSAQFSQKMENVLDSTSQCKRIISPNHPAKATQEFLKIKLSSMTKSVTWFQPNSAFFSYWRQNKKQRDRQTSTNWGWLQEKPDIEHLKGDGGEQHIWWGPILDLYPFIKKKPYVLKYENFLIELEPLKMGRLYIIMFPLNLGPTNYGPNCSGNSSECFYEKLVTVC